jgi:hypothetical protein
MPLALIAFPLCAVLAVVGVIATRPQGRLRLVLPLMAHVGAFVLGTIVGVLGWQVWT